MLYNTVHHNIRNAAGLSLLDYCILETVYLLSTSKRERYTGWCNASKSSFDHLATTRTIVTRFNSLEKRGWLEFKGENRYLKRATKKYYNEVWVYIQGVKKLHQYSEETSPPHEETSRVKELHPPHEETSPLPMKKLHPPHEETSPNKNIDKNTDNNIEKKSKGEKASFSDPDTPFSNFEENQEQEEPSLDAKNQSSERKKVAPKKESFPTPEPLPDIPFPVGFEKPPEPWYQNELDDLVNLTGFEPRGTWKNTFDSKKIETWDDDLKSAFVRWVFHFAGFSKWGVQATVIGTQQNKFIEFLKSNSKEDLIKAWERCQEENWKDWKIGHKRNLEDEQGINDKTKHKSSTQPDYSIWSQPIDLDD